MNTLRDDGNPLVHETIHEAVEAGDLADVRRHLSRGADVNAKDKRGWTPLHWAARNDQRGVIECLLACGADVNAKKEPGCTPLYLAVWEGYRDVAERLLVAGADPDGTIDEYSLTPLYSAVLKGDRNMAEVLLRHGAYVNAKNPFSERCMTPLDVAEARGHDGLVKLLRWHLGRRGREM